MKKISVARLEGEFRFRSRRVTRQRAAVTVVTVTGRRRGLRPEARI